jgi:Holliday junction DNA helicase RuvB
MELIGHKSTKTQLAVAMEAAAKRNKALPHMLFSGAAGCGKTSMARYIAEKTGAPFLSVVPNDLTDKKSVLKILDRLDDSGYDSRGDRVGKIKPTILFLDEVHNLPVKGQELLGLVMERFILESNTPNKYYWIPFFTLVGATTLTGKLTKPFRDRFKFIFNFQPYSLDEMSEIVRLHARRLGVPITIIAAKEVAKRSRGTPRVAVRYIERVRDKIVANGNALATLTLVKGVFKELGVDSKGFSTLELRILKALFESDTPVSLDNLSVILQEDSKNIKDFAEPYLIRMGLMQVSGRGRIITEAGKEHLNSSGKANRLVKKMIDFDYVRK